MDVLIEIPAENGHLLLIVSSWGLGFVEGSTGLSVGWLAFWQAHGIDERAWLEDVLRRMPEYELDKKNLDDLLPGSWTAVTITK